MSYNRQKEVDMKQLLIVIVLFVVAWRVPLKAQTYLDPAVRVVPTPPDVNPIPCDGSVQRSLVFAFAPMRAGCSILDLAVAKTTWETTPPVVGDPITYWFTYSYNVGGQFPNYDDFWKGGALCHAPIYLKKLVFGNLRPDQTPPRRDLVAIMSHNAPFIWRSELLHNTLSPPDPITPVQDLDGNAVDGAWGAFTSNDVLEDLALTDPNAAQLRIYPNNGDGLLNVAGAYVFSGYLAQKIVLAQVSKQIDFPVSEDKLDLVGVDGTWIKVWRNNNLDGLPLEPPYYQTFEVPFGFGTIQSLAVADIDNDGWNDIVVGANRGVVAYLNTTEYNGWIDENACWAYQLPGGAASRPHLVMVGDMGSPAAFGDAGLNDGWNDLVIASGKRGTTDQPTVRVFVNQRVPPNFFTFSPQQVFSFVPPTPPNGQQAPCDEIDFQQIALADVQGTGGLSLAATLAPCFDGNLYLCWHTPQFEPWNGGWNIAGISVRVPNYSPSSVFPNAVPPVYKYEGGAYVPVTGICDSNRGFWTRFPTTQPTWPVTYTGSFINSMAMPVSEGWNMIGSISVPVAAEAVLYNPQEIRSSSFFEFKAGRGYVVANRLNPGLGYWVKSNQPGFMILENGRSCPVPPEPPPPKDKFVVIDSEGNGQELYVVNAAVTPAAQDVEMPPPHPEFDARWESGNLQCVVQPTGEPIELPIALNHVSFPITLEWELDPENGLEYLIVPPDSGMLGKAVSRVSEKGRMSITSAVSRIPLVANRGKTPAAKTLPSEYVVAQNYPNPFNPSTQIHFELPKDGVVHLVVYDILGREVSTLVNEQKPAGRYDIDFNTTGLTSGVYFYRMQVGDFTGIKKMVLLK
jgi:hypothetical protein